MLPDAGIARGHHALAINLDTPDPSSNPDLAFILESLRTEIEESPGSSLILSSEELFGDRRINALKSFIRAKECYVYVSLRPQYEVLNANYYTEVTYNRQAFSPSEYFDAATVRLSYREKLRAFANFSTSTTLDLRVFDRGNRARQNPVLDFITQTGIPIVFSESDNVVEHPTLPAQPTLFLRWLNEIGVDQETFYSIFQSLHKMSGKLPRDMYTMSPSRVSAIAERFATENAEICDLYLQGGAKDLFLPAVIPSQSEWDASVGEDFRKIERDFLKKLCALAAADSSSLSSS